MIINHNLSAMFADRSLRVTNLGVEKGMEKLSSGMRINRAGDDASGLAVSEKMRSQIRGLNQASKNAANGISF
ncbi:MAG TPA: flagellin, partial [Spirochaetia bacterium]|nr:flagellin [Spirochaetia bacterium]